MAADLGFFEEVFCARDLHLQWTWRWRERKWNAASGEQREVDMRERAPGVLSFLFAE